MSEEIFVIKTMGDALRNTGYKSIQSAMSEIIDNSIQAEAKNIFVIVSEKTDIRTGRKCISEICFLDDGIGMTMKELGKCLGIGYSTRTNRKGMGRFGVGLPQASLYACPCVEVYSWQNGYENSHMVSLDINKIKSGEQTKIEDPIKTSIPENYVKYISFKIPKAEGIKEYSFKKHGTFVIWKECELKDSKMTQTLFNKLDFELGQKFRYFINEENCAIKLINHENLDSIHDIMPNDPLMLMNPNYVLGNKNNPGEIDPKNNQNCTETIFKPYTGNGESCPNGIVVLQMVYYDPITKEKKESPVEIRFSIVKDEFYNQSSMKKDAGSTPLGKHLKKLEGVSIVRANREIAFDDFDFYENTNQPQHRWWGCEVKFNPELDEMFGVANNKQQVELKRINEEDYKDEEIKPAWLQLYKVISPTIKSMYSTNEQTRKNSRSYKENAFGSTDIINKVEKNNNDLNNCKTEEVKKNSSSIELEKKAREILIDQGKRDPTSSEIQDLLKQKVNIVYKDLGKTAGLFDYSFELGNCKITINIGHIFYQKVLADLFETLNVQTSMELLIGALVKAIDETSNQEQQNDNLIATWNEKLRKYINEFYN